MEPAVRGAPTHSRITPSLTSRMALARKSQLRLECGAGPPGAEFWIRRQPANAIFYQAPTVSGDRGAKGPTQAAPTPKGRRGFNPMARCRPECGWNSSWRTLREHEVIVSGGKVNWADQWVLWRGF